jgi:hypothetical protein
VENKTQEQVAKWHIHMILRNGQKTCLERVLDSQQAWRSKITHEAAMQLGHDCKGERRMNRIDEKGEVGQHFV